jgi:uncharacterized protein YuzB (UPF0349 family)
MAKTVNLNSFSKEDPIVINYCLSNVNPEARCLLRQSQFHVIEDFCLHRCGLCYEGPFLIVDGEELLGDSHQEILERLNKG